MKKLAFLLASLLIPAFLGAETLAVSKWKGLNNNESAQIIDPNSAQDLLNIDVSHGGGSIKKRSGYGVYKALSTAKPMHGGYHFFDSSGNDVQVWGSSTSLYGVVADATPTQLISSATLNSTWDCADSAGFAYCVNSSRDGLYRTDGATQTRFASALGTMIETTPDRLVVAGVASNGNTIYHSQSNTYTNFTVGINATDPFTEVITAPGSKLTHLRWGCGKLLWWKDQSFGYEDFDNQYALQIKIVSDNIGTFDNTSAIDPGGNVWFRGQDGHIWKYDCTSLEKMSLDISSNTQASQKRVGNLWFQNSQADFQTGSIVPTANLSTTLSVGDVTVSSFSTIENSSTQWTSGSTSNMTVNPSSITLTLNNSGTVTDPSFESGVFSPNWTTNNANVTLRTTSLAELCGTVSAQSGTAYANLNPSTHNSRSQTFQVLNSVTGAELYSTTIPDNEDCTWRQISITDSADGGKRVKFAWNLITTPDGTFTLSTTNSYIFSGSMTFYYLATQTLAGGAILLIDNIQNGSSTITTGSFTSQAYDTGFTSSTFQITGFNWTANTSTPTFNLLTSTGSTGPFTSILTSSSTNATGNRYVKLSSTMTIGSTDNALSSINSFAFISRSTGTFYSAVKNAPNITSWSNLGVNEILNGGTETFYVRSSTNSFTVLSSTPAWTAQTIGALIGVSTGTYFQLRDDFAVTAATQTPTLNDFTFNWFEGVASDQAYMLYFNDAIWASVADGAGQTTNNYIFKNDLINDLWTVYNFGAGGMLVQGTNLYFGDTSAGNVYEFGTQTSDNGTAINAYWKSKDFTGSDPFLQNQLTQIDSFAKKNTGTTLTATYTVDNSTSTSYSMLLSTTSSIAESRKILPAGKNAYIWNIQYGDNSASSAWEFFGYRIMFTPNAYRPTQ